MTLQPHVSLCSRRRMPLLRRDEFTDSTDRPACVCGHSDHGSQYTSFAFGRRCREAGIAPSIGGVGSAYDNAMAESFFASLESRSSTAITSVRAMRRASPCSITSRPGTTRGDVTRRSGTSRRWSSKGGSLRSRSPSVRHSTKAGQLQRDDRWRPLCLVAPPHGGD